MNQLFPIGDESSFHKRKMLKYEYNGKNYYIGFLLLSANQ